MDDLAPDQIIDQLARRQLGLLDRCGPRGAGLSDDAIRHRVAGGRLVQVQEGVYRTFGSVPDWRQAVLAACLAAGPTAVASHRAAALLWGLISGGAPVEITVPLVQCPALA